VTWHLPQGWLVLICFGASVLGTSVTAWIWLHKAGSWFSTVTTSLVRSAREQTAPPADDTQPIATVPAVPGTDAQAEPVWPSERDQVDMGPGADGHSPYGRHARLESVS
jgi:hypothetical protein